MNIMRPIDDVIYDLRRCLDGNCSTCPGNGKHDKNGECQWPLNLVSAAHDILVGNDSIFTDAVLQAQKEALSQVYDIASKYVFTEYIDYETPQELEECCWDMIEEFRKIAEIAKVQVDISDTEEENEIWQ